MNSTGDKNHIKNIKITSKTNRIKHLNISHKSTESLPNTTAINIKKNLAKIKRIKISKTLEKKINSGGYRTAPSTSAVAAV